MAKLNWGKTTTQQRMSKNGADYVGVHNATTLKNGGLNPYQHSYKKHKVVLKKKKQPQGSNVKQQRAAPSKIDVLKTEIAVYAQKRKRHIGSIKSMKDSISKLELELIHIDKKLAEDQKSLETLTKGRNAT